MRVVCAGREIVRSSGREVVQHEDAMTVRQEPLDQVASDEAGTSGDDATHVSILLGPDEILVSSTRGDAGR